MPSEALTKNGTIIVLANSATHAPGATAKNNLGTQTDQLDLAGLVATEYRQCTKFDFGQAGTTWAGDWEVTAAIEPVSAPIAGGTCDFFVGFSQSSTAAQDNPVNLSGADAAYTGYGAADTDADEIIGNLLFIGSLIASADASIFVGNIGIIAVPLRHGLFVVQNNFSVDLAVDSIEMSIRLTPVITEGQ